MIVTVTMNPAIDKTVDITRLEKGDLNRIKRVEMGCRRRRCRMPERPSGRWAETASPQAL